VSRARASKEIGLTARVGVIALASIGGVVILALLLAWGGLVVLHGAEPRPLPAWPAPPTPRLEAHGGTTLAEVRRLAARRLAGYGWNDAARTTAHIPIDRAMQLRAAMGWADTDARP
jgi:hypothetical protein